MHSIQVLNNETENKGLVASRDRNVQIVVKTAEDELRQLLRERTEIMKRIGTILAAMDANPDSLEPAAWS
jgi:hypothetical protein